MSGSISRGPHLIAEAVERASVTDRDGRKWQYHSRSDHHSKVACIAVLADLLDQCPLLARHSRERRIAFGLNHQMRDFRSARKKDLDFVICRPAGEVAHDATSLNDLARRQGMAVQPVSAELLKAAVGSVLMALEAKACMTAHIKALPRLFDELNSSQQTVHGATHEAIAAGFVMINASEEFCSPPAGRLNRHRQPGDLIRTIEKVRELPRRSRVDDDGYDALGIVVVGCRNDGSTVDIVTEPPAPQVNDVDHYDRMIDRLATLYASRFKEL